MRLSVWGPYATSHTEINLADTLHTHHSLALRNTPMQCNHSMVSDVIMITLDLFSDSEMDYFGG